MYSVVLIIICSLNILIFQISLILLNFSEHRAQMHFATIRNYVTSGEVAFLMSEMASHHCMPIRFTAKNRNKIAFAINALK